MDRAASVEKQALTTTPFPLAGKRVWVAGHSGLLGRALVERLKQEQCEAICATHEELELLDRVAVDHFVRSSRPDAAIIAAARVGGVMAYRQAPASYFNDNLAMASNCIGVASQVGVAKLVYIASAAAYPEYAPQPIRPTALMTGPLDRYHDAYGLAKIAGIAMCRFHRLEQDLDFISVMPTNFYGPHGNDGSTTGHVIPTLLRRFHEARVRRAPEVVVWGTGKARRQFLHVDDCADAVIFALQNHSSDEPLNIAGDEEVSIAGLADMIAQAVGYEGACIFDPSKPDGVARRALDWSQLSSLGWRPRISLEAGMAAYYSWYLDNVLQA